MSLYVDDLAFSSNSEIPMKIILAIRNEFKTVKLDIKNRKLKRYSAQDSKVITGVVIKPNGKLEPTNKLKQKIFNGKKPLKISVLNEKELKSKLGQVRAARLISKDIYPDVYRQLRLKESR